MTVTKDLPPPLLDSPLALVARPRGTVLQRQGSPVERLRVLTTGRLYTESVDPAGRSVACGSRRATSGVGIEGLDGRPSAVDVRVAEDAVLLEATVEQVCRWVADDPAGSNELLRLSIDESAKQVAERELASGTARGRVARFLLGLESDARLVGWRGAMMREIAGLLGMRPETLSRTLVELRARGAIGPGKLEVREAKALGRIAEESSTY